MLGLFEDVLAGLAAAQVVVAQHGVVFVLFQKCDGFLAVDDRIDIPRAEGLEHFAQQRAHALKVVDDQEGFVGKQ